MWKVIIADDERLICRLIEALIDWETLDMEIVGKAENGLEALQMVKELHPHLLITDIRMPGCDGLDLIRQARDLSPGLEIVIISGYAHFEYAKTAIAYGVGSYILKPVNQEELNKTLKKIVLRLEERGRRERTEEDLIRDLLDGKREFTKEELAQSYQFHIQDCQLQTFFLKLDLDGDELGGPARAIIRQKAEEMFQTTMLPSCSEGALYLRNYAGCGLLSYPHGERDRVRRGLRELLKQLEANKNLFGPVEFTIGLGRPIQEAGELAGSMDAARLAAAERLIEGRGRMLEDVPPASGLLRQKVLTQYTKLVDRGIEILDEETLRLAREGLRTGMMAVDRIRGREIIELVLDAGRIFALRAGCGDGETQAFQQSCGQCGRTELLFRELERLHTRTLLELKERRENETTRPIRMAKQFIQENYGQNITLEDVCGAVGFSSAYFSALFKKETGEGFSKYLTQVRIDQAKKLLRETGLSVSEVCESVGYSDRKHFTQTFHKMTGVTPAEFRRLYG
ncbi:response regulator [Oscillospiraceae bacterium 38-13]